MPESKYDGTMDLEDHILAYDGHMMLYTKTDSVWCKVFPIILTGIAQCLVKCIPPGSISYWKMLSKRFTSHFVSSKRRHKMSCELMDLKKKVGERLRNYIARTPEWSLLTTPWQQKFLKLCRRAGTKEESKAGSKGKNDTYNKRDYTLKWPDKRKVGFFAGKKEKLDAYIEFNAPRAQIYAMHYNDDNNIKKRCLSTTEKKLNGVHFMKEELTSQKKNDVDRSEAAKEEVAGKSN
ncbi:Potassium-transporting ATPase KdpC subunit [Bienertia sinuspersici]